MRIAHAKCEMLTQAQSPSLQSSKTENPSLQHPTTLINSLIESLFEYLPNELIPFFIQDLSSRILLFKWLLAFDRLLEAEILENDQEKKRGLLSRFRKPAYIDVFRMARKWLRTFPPGSSKPIENTSRQLHLRNICTTTPVRYAQSEPQRTQTS